MLGDHLRLLARVCGPSFGRGLWLCARVCDTADGHWRFSSCSQQPSGLRVACTQAEGSQSQVVGGVCIDGMLMRE